MEKTKHMNFSFDAIGFFHTTKTKPYEAARQASVDNGTDTGCIILNEKNNFEQALVGLDKFSHIWVMYVFHQNFENGISQWKPMISPPRGSDNKVGVLASRSPYRPNPIGFSVLELKSIEGKKIFVGSHDLLDGTPILDIKPYVAYADSFPEATLGWIQNDPLFEICFLDIAVKQIEWLEKNGISELKNFINSQLQYRPTDSQKKRVKQIGNSFVLSYKTWRIYFEIDENKICVLKITSGYSVDEMISDADPYFDKDLHRKFQSNP
jgi:tRNA (adenine37-N6)-methyltransferase